MLNTKKRGLLASAGALVTAVALALGGAAAAQATTTDKAPERSGLVITKLEQPDTVGGAATGTQLGALPSGVIDGVSFEAYRVPLTNPALSQAGQQEIAGMTLDQAQTKVGDGNALAAADKRAGKTGAAGAPGEIRWEGSSALDAGLWLIRETATPAGVVAAGDFLVALPLTNPTDKTSWLDTVYVYPKNHTITGTKTVNDEDGLVVGDTVTWTIAIDNPSPRDPATGEFVAAGKLEVIDVLKNDELTPIADSITVKVLDEVLVGETDYTLNIADSADATTTVTVALTEQGLQKLQKNPKARVVIEFDTVVKKSDFLSNIATFTTSSSAPKETVPAVAKYGDFKLIKESAGATQDADVDLAGAKFMVFADEATANAALKGDAAARAKALKPATSGHDAGVWTTDAKGELTITGLRFSDFANGEAVADEDKQQTYWLVEIEALTDHQLLTAPVSFKLTDTSKSIVVVNQYDRGGFVLPLTGGTGTLMLTIVGIALLAVVLIVARRRQHAAE